MSVGARDGPSLSAAAASLNPTLSLCPGWGRVAVISWPEVARLTK